ITKKPAEITKKPAEITKKPAEITKKPAEITKKPAEITKKPAESNNTTSITKPEVPEAKPSPKRGGITSTDRARTILNPSGF
ncbi:MAG: hypothetical protein ABGX03_06530, partial [Methylophilaceae bacterium]